MKEFLFLLYCIVLASARLNNPLNKQPLNIHIVPHSHDDVGWIKTFNEYFDGSHPEIRNASVKLVIDNVVDHLSSNKDRKFIQVEIAFFYKWWNLASDAQKDSIRTFLTNGQLEFIGGGFSMNDEACTHYISIIDNMSVGHRFIADTFGEEHVPVIGWQIDPFGHSNFMASAFAEMGFIGEFFARIDYMDQANRNVTKQLEMIWRGSPSKPIESDIFTHKMYNHYNPPTSFVWENATDINNKQIIDDGSQGDNHLARVKDFIDQTLEQAKHYRSNNILTVFGGDFTYEPGNVWYENIDKLIHYANLDPRVNLFYSTPSIYTKSVHEERLHWESDEIQVKRDDFFPYSDVVNAYWSGFFSTRPNFKGMERRASHILQAARQMEVMAKSMLKSNSSASLDNLEQQIGISNHHDAITGNNNQRTADDYSKNLAKGMNEGVEAIKEYIGEFISVASTDLCHCMLSNQSRCECTNDLLFASQSIKLQVYNSLSFIRNEIIQVPVSTPHVAVIDLRTGRHVKSQIIPVSQATKNIPAESDDGLPVTSDFTLHFEALDLPSVGFTSFLIQVVDMNSIGSFIAEYTALETLQFVNDELLVIEGSNEINIHMINGNIVSYENLAENINVSLNIEYAYYKGFCSTTKQSDGEYIFLPDGDSVLLSSNAGTILIAKGSLVTEIHTSFGFVSSVIRTRAFSHLVEVEHTVGSIPIDDEVGKEIILRYTTNVQSERKMYTDSNGRDMVRRERDFRSTWDLDLTTQPISRNYFPVTTSCLLKDSEKQLTVLVDRSEGVGSLLDGQVEFMLHRRLVCDDHRCRGQPLILNELGPDGLGLQVRASHYFSVNNLKSAYEIHKIGQEKVFSPPILIYSTVNKKTNIILDDKNLSHLKLEKQVVSSSFFSKKKPFYHPNISILTLHNIGNGRVLVRLAHLYEKNEHSELSKDVLVDLNQLFPYLDVIKITETQLTGVIARENVKKLDWGLKDLEYKKFEKNNSNVVTIKPMEIRTFVFQVKNI